MFRLLNAFQQLYGRGRYYITCQLMEKQRYIEGEELTACNTDLGVESQFPDSCAGTSGITTQQGAVGDSDVFSLLIFPGAALLQS